MKINDVIKVAAPLLPLTLGVAALVMWNSREGRVDSYAFGSTVVSVGCAIVALSDFEKFTRLAVRAMWVVAMPFVAGGSTGFALALVHPKRDGLKALFGGAGIGMFGGVILFPALVAAALLVQLAAEFVAKRVRGPAAQGSTAVPQPEAKPAEG